MVPLNRIQGLDRGYILYRVIRGVIEVIMGEII